MNWLTVHKGRRVVPTLRLSTILSITTFCSHFQKLPMALTMAKRTLHMAVLLWERTGASGMHGGPVYGITSVGRAGQTRLSNLLALCFSAKTVTQSVILLEHEDSQRMESLPRRAVFGT